MLRSLKETDAILQGEFKKVTECKTFSFQQAFNIKIEFFNIKICTVYYIYRIFSLD